MDRLFMIAAAALALMLGAAAAQEQSQKSTGVETKTLLENEQMRVMEVQFKPGAKTTTLSHRNRFVYGLTDGALVFSPPGKTPYELSFKKGEAIWLPADEIVTQNDTDNEVRTLVVELKGNTAAAGKSQAKARRAGKPAKAKRASAGKRQATAKPKRAK